MATAKPQKHKFHAQFFSESAIYGLITVSALIIVTGRYDITAYAMFLKVLLAVVVFWAAHFFANVVAHLSEAPDGAPRFKESFKYAMSHSVGLLLAAVIPLTIVLSGVLDLVNDDTAVWVALWVDVSLLALFGFLSSRSWTRKLHYRFGAALVTTLLGVGIVFLKALIH
ncbi:hypothetical protein [Arthrobacter alpinus]|nr:hypothetical protein [Arthrobacter alpinus]